MEQVRAAAREIGFLYVAEQSRTELGVQERPASIQSSQVTHLNKTAEFFKQSMENNMEAFTGLIPNKATYPIRLYLIRRFKYRLPDGRFQYHGLFLAGHLGIYGVYRGPGNIAPALQSGAQSPLANPLA
ncbi:hypothetical protein M430DRAFT_24799 [Amorphotheca resinae ATCC 22711]|uniref:Uncharacterized protein n=1 Tax=Amorphotheca resinae ATCC 22711 TaxID=857342 RepID=A0A2T3BGC6_AMORE|nr:hypothetical protein M430DRAFT_24799 [Amorphotheca resinae ATCC 22711]PSS28470.1 hypothetical protein M430DRAFT_24799 [Amorphotheca resinae ATCC 22711]